MSNDDNDDVYTLTPEEIEQNRQVAEMSRLIPWMSAQDVADRLHVSITQVYRWVRKGRLPCRKASHRLLFLWLEIEPILPRLWHLIGRPERLQTSRPYTAAP